MKSKIADLNYDLYTKNVYEQDFIKKLSNMIVFDIQSITGSNVEIEIHVEQVVKRKNIFKTSIVLEAQGEQFFASKSGQRLYPILNKVKKIILKNYMKSQKKRHRYESFKNKYSPNWGTA
ncbi:MAG: hypothetical protein KDD58_02475 [Bdellovibrionales bacterium]|nr:hypothetical protein [Bdellovibrionales bacterium]